MYGWVGRSLFLQALLLYQKNSKAQRASKNDFISQKNISQRSMQARRTEPTFNSRDRKESFKSLCRRWGPCYKQIDVSKQLQVWVEWHGKLKNSKTLQLIHIQKYETHQQA